jgi:hypothetical protein
LLSWARVFKHNPNQYFKLNKKNDNTQSYATNQTIQPLTSLTPSSSSQQLTQSPAISVCSDFKSYLRPITLLIILNVVWLSFFNTTRPDLTRFDSNQTENYYIVIYKRLLKNSRLPWIKFLGPPVIIRTMLHNICHKCNRLWHLFVLFVGTWKVKHWRASGWHFFMKVERKWVKNEIDFYIIVGWCVKNVKDMWYLLVSLVGLLV